MNTPKRIPVRVAISRGKIIANAFLIIVSCLFANTINAQSTNIAEPEFSGNIVYVNGTNGSGIKLEQQTTSVNTRANGAAYVPIYGVFAGKATSKNVVEGSCSPVQIEKKPKMSFIVRVSDNSVDPVTVINIFKLKSEKDTRTLEVASAKIGSSKSAGIKYLAFNGTKYGQSSYLVEIDNIDPGEYAITLANRRDIFNMFGVK